MSSPIRMLTLGLLLLPLALLAATLFGTRLMIGPTIFVLAIYAWIWLRFRPTSFVVHPGELEVIWPLKRRRLRRSDIAEVRLIDRRELRREAGSCMRVGAGGLWGGFGWLWSQRRGIVQMYVSRTDGLVWIECGAGRPWLITPEQPEAFVRALSK